MGEMGMVRSIEERLQKLEDLESIRELTFHYADSVDRGVNGKQAEIDALDEIFTDDAVWSFNAMGVRAEGGAEIKAMLKSATGGAGLALHSFSNPKIAITGDTASGHWLLWIAVKREGLANQDTYTEELLYRRTDQGWRISSLILHVGNTLLPQ
jgi:ketosteroid isomerase-like protein